MKKIIFLLVFVGFSAKSQFSLGLKGGFILSKLTTTPAQGQTLLQSNEADKLGFTTGIWMELGKKLYIRPEFLYTERNGSVAVSLPTPSVQSVNLKYIDVPILLGYNILGILKLHAGAVGSYLLENQNIPNANIPKDFYKNFVWFYQLGAGVQIGGLSIELRREASLNEISSDSHASQRAINWQITAGFKIF